MGDLNTHTAGCFQGFLRKAGKTPIALSLKRKRFYKVDGGVLSKHSSETVLQSLCRRAQNAEAMWHLNMQGFDVIKLGRTHFAIVAKSEEVELNADLDEDALTLYAKTEEECRSWVSALKYAATRKLENHFELGPVIGEGGFAKVRLGRCKMTSELRAVKSMRKSDQNAKLFGTEIAVIKRVDHPNIVKTFDIYETKFEIHIVMEYMKGGMLYEAIEDGVRFREEDTVQFMRELLDGLYYLHKRGIVHRDIKPENVLCTSRDPPLHVKIADFGLSNIASVKEVMANQILMNTVIGTPEFIAPEIANRQTYSEKVDMWALGMLCYNVICGRLPFDESRAAMPQLRNGVVLTFPEPEWREYSSAARSFVKSLLCLEPEKRLPPLACLVHPWLEGQSPNASSKFGAFGRISLYLAEHGKISFSPRSSLSHGLRQIGLNRFGHQVISSAEIKRLWFVSYIATRAVNRLRWVVDSSVYCGAKHGGPETLKPPPLGNAKPFATKQTSDCSDDDEDSNSFGKDSSIHVSFKPLVTKDCRRNHKDSSAGKLPASSYSKLANAAHESENKPLEGDLDQLDVGVTRLRKKLLSALSRDTGSPLSPVRKFSKKLARMGSEKKTSIQSRSTFDMGDLDLNLDDLHLENVDERDLSHHDDLEDMQPSTLHGKRHRALLSASHLGTPRTHSFRVSRKRTYKEPIERKGSIFQDSTNRK